jgi:predicted Zn-dependent protease
MLNYLRNKHEAAFVLGHEASHILLGHHRSTWTNEYNADALGAKLAVKAGYSRCAGAKMLKRFHDKGSKTHPPSDARVKRIGC